MDGTAGVRTKFRKLSSTGGLRACAEFKASKEIFVQILIVACAKMTLMDHELAPVSCVECTSLFLNKSSVSHAMICPNRVFKKLCD